MTSEQAKELMDRWSIGVEGGPDILSDYDVKTFLRKDHPGVEQMAWVVKLQVRNKNVNHTTIHYITSEQWNQHDEKGRELLKLIANLNTAIGMRDMLTSAQYSV